MEHILKVSQLEKKYRNFSMQNISFGLPKGSIMGLIGENGAGKTTIIKSIMNLIQIEEGNISISD